MPSLYFGNKTFTRLSFCRAKILAGAQCCFRIFVALRLENTDIIGIYRGFLFGECFRLPPLGACSLFSIFFQTLRFAGTDYEHGFEGEPPTYFVHCVHSFCGRKY